MQLKQKFIALIPDFEPSSGARAFQTRYLGYSSASALGKTERRASDILEHLSLCSKDIKPDDLVLRDRMSRDLISIDLMARKHSFWTICPAGTRITWSTILRAFQYLSRSSYSR